MTNTVPWGKQGAAFEPGGPIPMLTCRLIKSQSPRGLGRAWHGLGSEAPSGPSCHGEKYGADDQGAKQNAQGPGDRVGQHGGAFAAEIGAEGGSIGIDGLGELLLVLGQGSSREQGERAGVAAGKEVLDLAVRFAGDQRLLQAGAIAFVLEDADLNRTVAVESKPGETDQLERNEQGVEESPAPGSAEAAAALQGIVRIIGSEDNTQPQQDHRQQEASPSEGAMLRPELRRSANRVAIPQGQRPPRVRGGRYGDLHRPARLCRWPTGATMTRLVFGRTRWSTPVSRTAVRFRSAPFPPPTCRPRPVRHPGAAMVSTGHEEGD